ncbi:hypothetical protein KCU81_g7221, partial [Aureobasidium melanogenum]
MINTMTSPSERVRRAHPAEVAPHPSELRNPILYNDDHHPLLKPEIVAIVLQHINDDETNDEDNDDPKVQSIAESIRVCRKWWIESHHLLWHRVQLRDLLFYVQDPMRRRHYASLVRRLDFKPDDTTLSTEEMADAALSFPRLHSVYINETNMLNVRPENISALMSPSLRLWSVDNDSDTSSNRNYNRDSRIYLHALLEVCGGLTQLDFDTNFVIHKLPLVLSILERIDSIEVLNLGDVAEYLANKCPQDFFSRLFNKPRLAEVDFPHATSFSQVEVDTFLDKMGRTWTMPSLESLAKPKFDTGTAAARLLSRMPNLVNIWLHVDGRHNDIDRLFIAAGRLENLELLDVGLSMYRCNFDGSWLLQLTSLEHLSGFALEVQNPGAISLTGAQLAQFLTSLPKLELLVLNLRFAIVWCSPEEKIAIEEAIAKIETVKLPGMTFAVEQSV